MNELKIVKDDATIFDKANEILERAKNKFPRVLIIGLTTDGITIGDTNMNNAESVFAMEHLKFNLYMDAIVPYDDEY